MGIVEQEGIEPGRQVGFLHWGLNEIHIVPAFCCNAVTRKSDHIGADLDPHHPARRAYRLP